MSEPTPSAAEKQERCNLCDLGFPLNEHGDHLPSQRLGMIPVTRCKKLPRHSGQAVDRQGEWTVQHSEVQGWRIFRCCGLVLADGLNRRQADQIVAAHNATLTKATEELQELRRVIRQLVRFANETPSAAEKHKWWSYDERGQIYADGIRKWQTSVVQAKEICDEHNYASRHSGQAVDEKAICPTCGTISDNKITHEEMDAIEQGQAVDRQGECVVDRTMSGARGSLLLPKHPPIVHWSNGDIDLDFAAKVINAALIAEREKSEKLGWLLLEAGKNLNTERQRREQAEADFRNADCEYQVVGFKKFTLDKRVKELEEQLLSALAAMDRQGEWQKRRYPQAKPDSDSWDIYAGETLIVGDLMGDECDKLIFAHNARIRLNGASCGQARTVDGCGEHGFVTLALLGECHKSHREELTRREADYRLELDAQLGQINAQAETITRLEGTARHMEACRSLLNVSDDDVLYEAIDDMQEQLLSAQAAIEDALKAPWTDVGVILAPIDLSLLHQHDADLRAQWESQVGNMEARKMKLWRELDKHDKSLQKGDSWLGTSNIRLRPVTLAEVRKPLVEALSQIALGLQGNRERCQDCDSASDVAHAALAQVKDKS